jgi:31-O-methyltransferase
VRSLRNLRLPNGLTVTQVNPWETLALYEEIFVRRCYARRRVVPPSRGVIVDVGANIGLTTLFFHRESPDASIISIEPAPAPRQALMANIRRHRIRAQVIEAAVDSHPGRRSFTYYPRHSIASGFHADPGADAQEGIEFLEAAGSLAATASVTAADLQATEQLDCDVLTLEEVLRVRPDDDIALLKIDAERCENGILDGIGPGLWPRISQVVAEIHDHAEHARQFRLRLEAHGMVVTTEQHPLCVKPAFMVYATRHAR